MISGQFVVVRVGVHQLSVPPNTSHPMLQICSKLLHGNSMPSLNSCTYNSHPRSPWKALSNWAVQQALERGCKLRSAWTTLRKVSLLVLSITVEKLDSWPKPVELQRCMSTFSEYSPVSGRSFHTYYLAFQKMQMKRRQRARGLSACLQKNNNQYPILDYHTCQQE